MITAAIVLFNTPDDLLDTIVSSYAPGEGRKLYLIDNSPKENAHAKAMSCAWIEYIFPGKNLGYGSANNIGFERAISDGADYHVVLNPDLEFDPSVIDTLADYADHHPDVVYILPKVVYPDGSLQYLCKLLPTPSDLFLRRFLPDNPWSRKHNDRYVLMESGYNRIINPPCLSGCFMFMRVSTLKEHNLFFDERFFMYMEDFDLIRRLHRVGKTIFYPDAQIVHKHEKSSYKNLKALKTHLKSAYLYFNKYGWFFDRERKSENRKILEEIRRMPAGEQTFENGPASGMTLPKQAEKPVQGTLPVPDFPESQDGPVSVAMTVYNGEKYLAAQLESILVDLKAGDELLVSYDRSTDASWDILMRYQKKFPELVRVVENQKPGVTSNFENAIRNAQNPYIFLSDQDDLWVRGKRASVLKSFREEQADFVIHNAVMVDADGKVISKPVFDMYRLGNGLLKNIVKSRYSGCCMAFRKTLVPYMLPIPEDTGMYDRWLALVGEIKGKVVYNPDILLQHRLHGDNVTDQTRALPLLIKERALLCIKLLLRTLRGKEK